MKKAFSIRRATTAAVFAAAVPSGAAFAAEAPSVPSLPPWQPVTWIDTVPRENDEKPCTVDSLEIEARVSGLFARVSTTTVVSNPNSRAVSAPMAFPLPDGAAVCGCALDVGNAMVDGVVVPKEKARVAFETEQRRGVDPALVESVKGNVWRTRVYPVPARGTRTVRVDWVAPLAVGPDGASAALALPMPDCTLSRRTVSVEVDDSAAGGAAPLLGGFGDTGFFADARRTWRASGTETNLAPRSDVLIALPRLPDKIAAVERDPGGDVWFCASVRGGGAVTSDAAVVPGLDSFTVFWDASGSRAGGSRDSDILTLRTLAAQLPGDAPIIERTPGRYRLVVFRDKPEPAREFGTRGELVEAVLAIGGAYDGGTDLAAVSAAVRETAGPVFLFTDGLDTLSGEAPDFGGRQDVAAFVSGPERDMASLRRACAGRVFESGSTVAFTLGPDGALHASGEARAELSAPDGALRDVA
ncbi:MAG: hypothetical protein IJ678_08900, partial [Kiritimatiellae bacterium]|nr:hypothetical protein [Kiritimatiellia bacterium]